MSEGREYLTAAEFRGILCCQGGVCAKCKGPGPFEADHSTPNAHEPGKPDQLLCRTCHKEKTFGLRGDISSIAKAKRIRDGRTQYDKRKAAGGSRIRGRGFDRTKTKKLSGEVVERK